LLELLRWEKKGREKRKRTGHGKAEGWKRKGGRIRVRRKENTFGDFQQKRGGD